MNTVCSGPGICAVRSCGCACRAQTARAEYILCDCCLRRLSDRERRFLCESTAASPSVRTRRPYTMIMWAEDVRLLLDMISVEIEAERKMPVDMRGG